MYSATKGGVTSFAKSLARETARHGITVNVVCPGPIRSALLDQFADADTARFERLVSSIPLRRVGEPTDVAPAVGFLLSPGAAYITGQTLSISGGLTMI